MSGDTCYDLAIAGDGPAGAVLAKLAAEAGQRVALVGSGLSRRRFEGLSDRTLTLLRRHGVEPQDLRISSSFRRVDWGASLAPTNREHVVDRALLDLVVRNLARDRGVDVIVASIARVEPGTVHLSDGERLRARRVVEARGRRAPSAALGVRGPKTIAISGWIAASPEPGSAIVSLPEGWLWQADIEGCGSWRQLCVDHGRIEPGQSGLARVWQSIVSAQVTGELRAKACELRLMEPELDSDLPRIGDASVAMDPLTGHGLYWALTSAHMAMPILNALEAGEVDLATEFHRERVVGTFWRQARLGRDFYRLPNFPESTDFWTRRRSWPDDEPAHPKIERPIVVDAVFVDEGRLRRGRVLKTPQEPDGVAFVCGVAISTILHMLEHLHPIDESEFVRRMAANCRPETARNIFAWLTSRGMFEVNG